MPLAQHATIRPANVREALQWLTTHNPLYADAVLDFRQLEAWSANNTRRMRRRRRVAGTSAWGSSGSSSIYRCA